MSKIEDGGPAFSRPECLYPDGTVSDPGACGMSLRDYFAAKAITGMLAGMDQDGRRFLQKQAEPIDALAKAAYNMADAMIRARGNHEQA